MSAERGLVLGAGLLYLLALALPAIEGSGFADLTGLDVLRRGAGVWRDGIVAWYANPALAVALALIWLGRWRAGLAMALVGLLLAVSSMAASDLAIRAGRAVPEYRYGTGFYVWIAAFAVAVAAAGLGLYKVSASRRR